MPAYNRQTPTQRLPFAGVSLRQFGRDYLLYMPEVQAPTYISRTTTPLWQLLAHQLNPGNEDNRENNGEYFSISNPMLNAGTPQNVVQHTLENPTEHAGSGNSAHPAMITGETLVLTGADQSSYPVCNLQHIPETETRPTMIRTVQTEVTGFKNWSYLPCRNNRLIKTRLQ